MGGIEREARGYHLSPKLLLDTHILVRWLTAPKKLSKEQARALRAAVAGYEPVAVSTVTLMEIATIFGEGSTRSEMRLEDLLGLVESHPGIRLFPITVPIAAEMGSLGLTLRDPADRAIVATARVHKLKLVTSDQLIIESKLVSVIE